MAIHVRRSPRWLFLSLGVLGCYASGCGSFDDRTLARRGAASVAGESGAGTPAGGASAGSAASDAGDAGEAGTDEPAEGGKPSLGGTGGAGGGAGTAGGVAGALAGSVAMAGASSGSGGAAAGAPGGAGSAGTGASGAAGAPGSFPCGDINGNAVDDCTETALVNSRFDADTASWSIGFSSVQAWDARDALGKPSSGSILISNTLPTAVGAGLAMTGTGQCVPAEAGSQFDVAVRVFVPSGQGGGQAGLNLWAFANDGCAGTLLEALTPTAVAVVDQWSITSGKLEMPAGSRSLLVRLVAAKPLPQTKLDVLFDDVLLKKLP